MKFFHCFPRTRARENFHANNRGQGRQKEPLSKQTLSAVDAHGKIIVFTVFGGCGTGEKRMREEAINTTIRWIDLQRKGEFCAANSGV